MRFFATVAFGIVVIVAPGSNSGAQPLCKASEPWGAPMVTDGHHIVTVCHEGYSSGLDSQMREPRWVSYLLTSPHDLGCYPRTGLSFKVDSLAPAKDQGRASDYRKSGYDLGHMAPNEDFAWSKAEQRDTFSMVNVNPQLPGLNRQGWERLEEDVRAWALQRGSLQVYVGPIYGGSGTIGADALPVPTAFFKVVVDRQTSEAMGFIMPQQAVPKGPPEKWRAPIATIQTHAKVSLPLPPQVREEQQTWPADLSAWRVKHQAACQK